jgi:hypothetical protein
MRSALRLALTDECRRAEIRIGEAPPQARVGDPAQVGVDGLEEAVERAAVAVARALDQLRDVAHSMSSVLLGCADPIRMEQRGKPASQDRDCACGIGTFDEFAGLMSASLSCHS